MNTTKYTLKTNKKECTITFRIYDNNKLFSKYKTIKLNKKEIEDSEQFTQEDIKQYLRNNNNYYKIK